MFFLFLSDNKVFILLDLLLKLVVVFLPAVINTPIEKIVATLHLQELVEMFRSFFLQRFILLYCLFTNFLYDCLSTQWQNQFKKALQNCIQKNDQNKFTPNTTSTTISKYKIYENTGAQCDLINLNLIEQQKRQKQLLRLQLTQKKIQTIPNHNILSNYSNEKIDNSLMKKKNSYIIQRSNTDLGINQEEQRIPSSYQVRYRKNDQISSVKPQNYQRPSEKVNLQKQDSQPSMILNKLDASQYSDMFDDEFQESQGKKLQVKVQAIIEIGGLSTARLEIYNIQLYSNRDIRIVSLYGREFEKHRLISMKALKHGYYELKLQGGKVGMRKVKFRGSFEPFLQYLQTDK